MDNLAYDWRPKRICPYNPVDGVLFYTEHAYAYFGGSLFTKKATPSFYRSFLETYITRARSFYTASVAGEGE